MEIREFIALADAVIERLAPLIDAGRARSIRRSAGAGSWEAAIPELAAVLAHEQTTVTADDRDQLRRLLTRLGESAEEVDRLNIEPGKD